jgi:AraC-like DNA-binding protein/mannose-6-phosphate isomerase-like protein (cupin superfamily)
MKLSVLQMPKLDAQTKVQDCGVRTCEPQLLAVRTSKVGLPALSKGHYPGVTIPNDILPGLNSIGFWDCAGPQNWGLDFHRHANIEIHFVETGNLVFIADERRFNLHPGDLMITRPWQSHKLGDPHIGPGRVHWLIVDVGVRRPNDRWHWPDWVTLTPTDVAELTQKLRHNKMPVCRSNAEIARIFQQTAKCVVGWKTRHSISRMVANLNQLFVSLLDLSVTQRLTESSALDSRRRVVELFLKGLENSKANCQEIGTLQQMAEHCGLGITSFAKYTREVVNVGPMAFLKQCRLNHAAQELRGRPDISITDVSFSNGFNSSQYFSDCFRKRFQMSPTQFLSKRR